LTAGERGNHNKKNEINFRSRTKANLLQRGDGTWVNLS